jgi:hypothetical protein
MGKNMGPHPPVRERMVVRMMNGLQGKEQRIESLLAH